MTPANINTNATPSPETATSDERQRLIVFFDGVCVFCSSSVHWLKDRDTHARLTFAPLQGETAARLLARDDVQMLGSVVFWSRGEVFRHSTAISRMLLAMGGVWSWAGRLLAMIPRPLRDWGYRLVASNRYLFLGRDTACRLPTPHEQSRFLP